jgi:branched-chain amino acid transport system substrate-binding protein
MLMQKYPDIKSVGDLVPRSVCQRLRRVHLTAIVTAGSGTSGDQIAMVLQDRRVQRLIKTYSKPFSPTNHDALNENDYIMVKYDGRRSCR